MYGFAEFNVLMLYLPLPWIFVGFDLFFVCVFIHSMLARVRRGMYLLANKSISSSRVADE